MLKSAFIVAQRVQPGDIILETSADNGALFWGIRISTLSRYTHASVLATRLGRLEVAGPGRQVGIEVGEILQRPDGSPLMALEGPNAVVLRVRGDAERRWRQDPARKRNRRSVVEEAQSAVLAYLGRDYASDRALVDTLPAPLHAISRLLGGMDADERLFRKWFCSSLVAQVYDDFGMRLTRRAVSRTTPGSLSRSRLLAKVPGAVARLSKADVDLCTSIHRGGQVPGGGCVARLGALAASAVVEAASSGVPVAAERLDDAIEEILREPVEEYRALLKLEARLLGEERDAPD